MKDLYSRNDLPPYESDIEKIKQALRKGGMDSKEGRFVLLHAGRKRVYDRTHSTLTLIGKLRSQLKLNDTYFWNEKDFTFERKDASNRTTKQEECVIDDTENLDIKDIYDWLFILSILIVSIVFINYQKKRGDVSNDTDVIEGAHLEIEPEVTKYFFDDSEFSYEQEKKENKKNQPIRQTKYVTAQKLNIRTSPSAKGAIIGQLERFDTVEADEYSDSWSEITYEGNLGYVASR